MNTLISFLVLLVYTIVSIYLVGYVLYTVFYLLPRIYKERQNHNLLKEIPLLKIFLPAIFLLSILSVVVYLSTKYLPDFKIEILIGIAIGLLVQSIRSYINKEKMEEYFKSHYKMYLRSENNITSNSKSKYQGGQDSRISAEELKPLIVRALEKYTVGDYRSAIALYDQILDINPNLARELAIRASCLERLNYNLDAIDDYEKAIEIDSSDGNIYGLLGLAKQKIGHLDEAEAYLKQAIANGFKMYEPNLQLLTMMSEKTKQLLVEKGSTPENLIRRSKVDFEDDLAEIDRKVYNDYLIKQIEGIKYGLALDPNNKQLQKLYNHFYSKLN